MKRPYSQLPSGEQDEVTPEITGFDASMDEADVGDAGNGADVFGADLTGGLPTDIEGDPDQPEDIVPDRIERFPGQPADEDREITAQPNEPLPVGIEDAP